MPAAHRLLKLLLWIIASILIAGFIAINIVVPLPTFLITENIFVAVAIAMGLFLVRVRVGLGSSILIFVALFYAGRISRSVVTPSGALAPMWEAHAPVTLLLVLLGILSLLMLLSRCGSGGLNKI